MKRLFFPLMAFVAGFISLTLFVRVALAQDAGADVPALVDAGTALDAGSGSAVVSTTTITTTTGPADALHNPVDDPTKAVDDAKQAKKQGWAAFILVLIIMVTGAFARASAKWPTLPVLATINKHKTIVLVVACLGVGATSIYNALAGGSWYAALLAGAIAAAAFINPAPSTSRAAAPAN